ncbi:MAG: DUF1579 domain-containing protein [Acidobacteriota bacterium]
MRPMVIRFAAGAILAAALVSAPARAQEKEGQAPPAPSQEMQAMMEAYAKAAQPGPGHAFLAQLVGTFKATVKSWMGPGEPEVSEGISENTMIFGGRYLHQKFTGSVMGQTFEGLGLTGFDNTFQKFTGLWIDSMSTGMMTSEASLDATGKVLNSVETYPDPLTGKVKRTRSVLKIVDADTHVMEMYDVGPDGKEFRMMEITYRRK